MTRDSGEIFLNILTTSCTKSNPSAIGKRTSVPHVAFDAGSIHSDPCHNNLFSRENIPKYTRVHDRTSVFSVKMHEARRRGALRATSKKSWRTPRKSEWREKIGETRVRLEGIARAHERIAKRWVPRSGRNDGEREGKRGLGDGAGRAIWPLRSSETSAAWQRIFLFPP